MSNKPIAVISPPNVIRTVEWLKQEKNIIGVNTSQRSLWDADGTIYVIITSYDQSKSWEFSDVIISPEYILLEEMVRRRIK